MAKRNKKKRNIGPIPKKDENYIVKSFSATSKQKNIRKALRTTQK